MSHEFLSIYPAKLLEYGLAVLYLVLFVPFWSYVRGGARRAAMKPAVKVGAPARPGGAAAARVCAGAVSPRAA